MHCGKPLKDETEEYCPDCGKRLAGKHVDSRNPQRSALDQGRSLWLHREPVSGALYRFKYRNRRRWGRIFAQELAGRFAGTIRRWKIDAVTGEIVWHTDYQCYTVQDVSGGVQGSPAMGKYELEDLVFFPVARYPNAAAGWLVALNKQTGELVWNVETQVYSWSSPTAFYTEDGKGYLIYCTSGGYMYLLDGLTGKALDFIDLGSNIEASPAIYENTVVVGTRSNGIWGVTMK